MSFWIFVKEEIYFRNNQKQTMFKIGDKVLMDEIVVTVKEFGEVANEPSVCVEFENGKTDWYAYDDLKAIEPKTLENLERGDVIQKGDCFMRILAKLGGERELTTYAISRLGKDVESRLLKEAGGNITSFEIKKYEYRLYTPEPEKTDREKLVEEYAKKVVMWLHGTGTVKISDILNEFADKLLK